MTTFYTIRHQSSKNVTLLPRLNIEHVDSNDCVNVDVVDVDNNVDETTNLERRATFRLFYPETETSNPGPNPVSENGCPKNEAKEPPMPPMLPKGVTPILTVEHFDRPDPDDEQFRTRVASFRLYYPDNEGSNPVFTSISGSFWCIRNVNSPNEKSPTVENSLKVWLTVVLTACVRVLRK